MINLTASLTTPPTNDSKSINFRYERSFSEPLADTMNFSVSDGSNIPADVYTAPIGPGEEGYWATRLIWTDGVMSTEAVWVSNGIVLHYDTFTAINGTKIVNSPYFPDKGLPYYYGNETHPLSTRTSGDGTALQDDWNGLRITNNGLQQLTQPVIESAYFRELYISIGTENPVTNFYLEFDVTWYEPTVDDESYWSLYIGNGSIKKRVFVGYAPDVFHDRGETWHQIEYNGYSGPGVNYTGFYYQNAPATIYLGELIGGVVYGQPMRFRSEYIKDVGVKHYINGQYVGMYAGTLGYFYADRIGLEFIAYTFPSKDFIPAVFDNLKVGLIGTEFLNLQTYENNMSNIGPFLNTVSDAPKWPTRYKTSDIILTGEFVVDKYVVPSTIPISWTKDGPKSQLFTQYDNTGFFHFNISTLETLNTIFLDFTDLPDRVSRKSFGIIRNGQNRVNSPNIGTPAYLDALIVKYRVGTSGPYKTVAFNETLTNVSQVYLIFETDGFTVSVYDARHSIYT